MAKSGQIDLLFGVLSKKKGDLRAKVCERGGALKMFALCVNLVRKSRIVGKSVGFG